jgi:3-deoxy-7-phosphoheptulonate synthase
MIVVMTAGATQDDTQYVVARAQSLGLRTHVSLDNGRTVISLTGGLRGIESDALSGLRGVERVASLRLPYRLTSSEYKSERSIIPFNGLSIGGDEIMVMAGPCSVESQSQLLETAVAVKNAGAKLLRGGAFKPRTSPYSFQGMGEPGLKLLAEAREQTGLLIVTEVMSPEQVPLVCEYADVLQIGTRNMLNYSLLQEVGRVDKPILLKRGMMSTINEFLMSAEYILSHGNNHVMLCERGIRTFETYTRNTLDINAVGALKELTHLPVIVDPSHATGKASLVASASRAAVAAGADGLIIEVHNDPDHAWSDGDQSLNHSEFEALMGQLKAIAVAVGRTI